MGNRSEQQASRDLGSNLGSATATAIDQMIRWPFWFTGATMDLMLQAMERMTGPTVRMMGSQPEGGGDAGRNRSSGSDWASWSSWTGPRQSERRGQETSATTTGDDQDLSGDDLKYVLWSILFNKPGYEAVLEPQQAEIVNYSADGNSFAAVKIAKFLEKARNGRAERPAVWMEKAYPADTAPVARRAEPTSIGGGSGPQDRGWRVPADDQKYIRFVYRVERRLPKEELEVTHIERVTIERGGETRASAAG